MSVEDMVATVQALSSGAKSQAAQSNLDCSNKDRELQQQSDEEDGDMAILSAQGFTDAPNSPVMIKGP